LRLLGFGGQTRGRSVTGLSDRLVEHVRKSEGLRLRAYQCPAGVWTIGYGTNLQELRIDIDLAEKWLQDKLADCLRFAQGYSWWHGLNRARQDVVIDMLYNLGPTRFNGFRRMHAAILRGDFDAAAAEMLDSRWATQVGRRARHLSNIMKTGVWD
jgi:lysozyme